MFSGPMLFLSACGIAGPLLAAWLKLWLWELHRRYGYDR